MFTQLDGKDVMVLLMTILEYREMGTLEKSAALEYIDTGELVWSHARS